MWRWLVAGAVIVALLVVVLVRTCHRTPAKTATTTPQLVGSQATRTTSFERDAAPLPKPPIGGLRLEGQVIDEADQPVANAKVRFYNFDHETATGEDGSFVFEHLGADEYQVIAEAPDTWCDMVRVELATTNEPVILRLHPAGVAIVRVTDADGGKPIAGARLHGGVTDAAGEFRVHGLRPGGNNIYLIGIDADSYEHSRVVISGVDLGTPSDNIFNVEMHRGVAIAGTVLDPNGAPVAGAIVSTKATGHTSSDAETDAAGAWVMSLSSGTFELTAESAGRESPPITIEVAAEPKSGIVLRLRPAVASSEPDVPEDAGPTASIAGIVVDTRGRPAPGVRVSTRRDFEDTSALTDAKGHFELRNLVPGDYSLFVAHTEEEFSRPSQGVDASTGARDVRLVVTDVGSVSGRVVLDGKPVSYFGAWIEEADVVHDRPTIVQSPDGRFTIKGIVAGTWSVVLAGPSFGRKIVKATVPEDGNTDLGDIAVDRGRTIHGRVTDANGGVPGATVSVHERDLPRDSLSRAVEGTGTATTDANGAYRITGLSPPLYETARHINAKHPTRGVSIDRKLADGDTEVNLTLSKPGSIEGRLEGMDTGVLLTRVDDRNYDGVSPDDKGHFQFDNLAPGAYRVRPNGVTAVVAIVNVISGQRVKVPLVVPPERIEVQIVGNNCKSVTLSTEDNLDVLMDEACTIENVPPGAYRACVDGKCIPIKVAATPPKQSFTPR